MEIKFKKLKECSSCLYFLQQNIYQKILPDEFDFSILVVPLSSEYICKKFSKNDENCWKKFIQSLNSGNLNDYQGILFFTYEEIPRGDFPDSVYNQSRMIRQFFENTTYAKTANYTNTLEKLKELIVEIELNKKKTIRESLKDFKKLINGRNIDNLSRIYTYQSFHTQSQHGMLRNVKERMDKGNDFSDEFKKYCQNRQDHDIASIVATNPLRFEKLNILVIDDNPGTVEKDFEKILCFFPEGTEIYITKGKEYKKFLYDENFLKELLNGEAKLNFYKILTNSQKPQSDDKLFEEIKENGKKCKKFKFQYVIIDLLLGDYNEGNKIIRELVKFRHIFNDKKKKQQAVFNILAYSLSDDIEDISRAFDEGALGYVWKFGRIYTLPSLIAELEQPRKKLEYRSGIIEISRGRARGFTKLYQLLPETQLRLSTEPFLELSKDENGKIIENKLAEEVAKNWIKKFPKADLHYHIGGSMDEDLIFYLATNSFAWFVEDLEKLGDNKAGAIVEKIVNYILPKEALNSLNVDENTDFYEAFFKEYFYGKLLINSLNELEKKGKKREELKKKEEKGEKLDDIQKWLKTIHPSLDKIKLYIEKKKNNPADLFFEYTTYLVNKDLKEEKGLKGKEEEKEEIKILKDQLIIIFIVVLGVIEERTVKEAKNFFERIKGTEKVKGIIDEVIEKLPDTKKSSGESKKDDYLRKYLNAVKDKFKPKILEDNKIDGIISNINGKINSWKDNLKELKYKELIRSLNRVPEDCKSLEEMFRGDCFNGKVHLQCCENIVACVFFLVEKAVEENIRYLEIRVSPSGYTEKDLSLQEAVNALFAGADIASLYFYLVEKKFIWVNFITTLKRHKEPVERTLEMATAIIYREREVKNLGLELGIIHPSVPYKWKPSKIVGVDLAGQEGGYNPAQFIDDFMPVFKVCSFITIHAGEETPAQYIWEAIYKLHSHRIGHGLSLKDYPNLLELVKNSQICIEMAPTSNEKTGYSKDRVHKYPFFKYISQGLNVTINTDDKGILETTLSDEYVKAAKFFLLSEENERKLSMTKWEVLRIIKAGFDNAFISREEKRELLQSVENEVYEKILQDYEIEPIYPVDS